MKNKFKNFSLALYAVSVFCISCKKKQNETSNIETKMDQKEVTPLDLDSAQLFLEYDKSQAIKVNDNVTRKFLYLNGIMTVIVDFDNGPMKEPDPFHSHIEEQTCYVAEGEVLVIIGDNQQTLKAGDIFVVPSNVPHTVQSLTKRLRLVDSFNPIRKDFIE